MTAHFGLDAEQEVALFDLLDGYYADEQAREEALEDAIDAGENIENDDDWGAAEERIDALEAEGERAAAERVALFYEDARLLLSPEQNERWALWERARRRLDLLPHRAYSGDGVDLTRIARELDVSGRLGEALEAYEVELDAALIRRYEARRHARERIEREESPDLAWSLRAMSRARRASWDVAELNRTYARRLADALGGDLGEGFLERYERTAHRRLFYPRDADRVVRGALLLDLDTQDREVIEAAAEELEAARARAIPMLVAKAIERERSYAMGDGDPRYPFHALGLREERLTRPFELTQDMRSVERGFREKGGGVIDRVLRVLDDEQIDQLRALEPTVRLPAKGEG